MNEVIIKLFYFKLNKTYTNVAIYILYKGQQGPAGKSGEPGSRGERGFPG